MEGNVNMRHLYGMPKTAAQKKQAFAQKLASFMKEQRGTGLPKTAAEAKAHVKALLRQALGK